ncbi:MAG: carcinine hydrolase/isopenicillin-N N-acyltransferase family protein, partial [Candidatus Bilamarchaeaceae archaeon]
RTKETLLIGRNFDWIREAADTAEVYSSVFPAGMERHSFVAVTDIEVELDGRVPDPLLYHNPLDAINEMGLYIGLTFSHYQNTYGFGIPTPKAIQLVAETCANVREALELFRLVPITNPKNFFIADRGGEMAVVEHTGGGSTNFRIIEADEAGMLGKTNHILHPDLASGEKLPEGSTSRIRYDAARNALENAEGAVTLEKMMEVFLSPPVHKGMDTSYPTIWSLFMDMGRGIYELVRGDTRQTEEGILRIR